jgi:uncharacterized membrane protein YagU involved in acid resistance
MIFAPWMVRMAQSSYSHVSGFWYCIITDKYSMDKINFAAVTGIIYEQVVPL